MDVEQMKLWSRMAPLPYGKMPNGDQYDALGLKDDENAVFMCIDSRGRVFQLEGCSISGGTFRQINKGLSETHKLLEMFDVQDIDVAWDSIRD